MFYVKCGSDVIHDPTGKRPGCLLAEPVLSMAVGRQGSFSFEMPPTHPMYGQLHDRTSYLAVLDDTGEIWRGRVISQEKGWENLISIYAEGELAYLQDTVMRPYVFSGTRKEFLRILIRNHNEQLTATDISISSLDNPRKFTLDTANSDVDSDPISVTISDGDSIWSLIDEYIIRAGYYPVTYKSGDTVYIKFVSDFPDSTQQVKFAENLLDLTYQRNAADVITKLIPYGATLESGDSEYEQKPQSGYWHGNRRTIRNATAGDGSDIIKNNAARQIFGDIVGIKVYNDITGADELYAAASADLAKLVNEAITISARAVDISLLNGSTPLRVGYYHTTYSPLHGINLKLLCSEAEIDLSSPDKSTYEFGAGQKTLTDLQTTEV